MHGDAEADAPLTGHPLAQEVGLEQVLVLRRGISDGRARAGWGGVTLIPTVDSRAAPDPPPRP